MFAYKRAPPRHHSQVDEVSPQDKQRARTHKRMRYIVFVILLIVTTGSLARPRADEDGEAPLERY